MTSTGRYSSPPPPTPEPVQESPADRVSPSDSSRRIARLLILAGCLIILLWAGIKTWRVYEATQSLLAVEDEARSLMAQGINAVDPDAAESLVLGARRDIATLHSELAFIRPIAPYLGWVPRFGPTLVAAPHLLEMADAGAEAGALSVSSLKPALTILQDEEFSAARLGDLLPVLSSATPELEKAAAEIEHYASARAALDNAVEADTLPWRVRQLLELSDKWLPMGEDGLRLAPRLPALLGQDGPRRYLILAQNEDEMRATGGFITGAGIITIQKGQIVNLEFRDANNVDNWREKPYAFPPEPYYDFMGLELFGFRDANFWPEFPLSAEKAMALYEYGQGVPPFDGVIAIDQEFLRLLVDGTGPVPIPGTDISINADNLLQTLRQARDIQEGQDIQEWVRDRKAFLGGFAAAIQAKLESDFSSVDPVKMATNLIGAAENRHLSIYMREPQLAGVLHANGWDGSLPQAPPGDFLMVVDTNMGYNKANVFIERALNYEVSLAGPPLANLTVTYQHTGPASETPCYQGVDKEFEEAAEYLAIADQCYWNYLRVYAPLGSTLADSSHHTVPGETLFSETTWEGNGQPVDDVPWLTTFANFLLVPRGEQEVAFFNYELPAGVITEDESGDHVYKLKIYKQPGTKTEKLTVTVTLPDGADLIDAAPAPSQINGRQVTFDLDLNANLELTMQYGQ